MTMLPVLREIFEYWEVPSRKRTTRYPGGTRREDPSPYGKPSQQTRCPSHLPLAVIAAHPRLRELAETRQESGGLPIAGAVYRRNADGGRAGATARRTGPVHLHLWAITAPQEDEMHVVVRHLPLRTSGLAEGMWWLQRRTAPALPSPEKEVDPTEEAATDAAPAEKRDEWAAPRGTTLHLTIHPIKEVLAEAAAGAPRCVTVDDIFCSSVATSIAVTTLELIGLRLHPLAIRLLPCLFGKSIATLLVQGCSAVYDACLQSPSALHYNAPPADSAVKDTGFGALLPRAEVDELPRTRPQALFLSYGAASLRYLRVSQCASEVLWRCIGDCFILPRGTPRIHLAPLVVLDISSNRNFSAKQLNRLLQRILERHSMMESSPELQTAPPDESGAATLSSEAACKGSAKVQFCSLGELNLSNVKSVTEIPWSSQFSSLTSHLRRLSMASCDLDEATVLGLLGSADCTVASAGAPRRLELLDLRWNIKVDTSIIAALRTKHYWSCQHLRVAGTAIERKEAELFADLITP